MVVRIRYARRTPLTPIEWRQLGLTLAALLTPCALLAFTMAFWIFAANMQWLGEFFITKGLLSRWEIWVSAAAILLFTARLLDKISQPYPVR